MRQHDFLGEQIAYQIEQPTLGNLHNNFGYIFTPLCAFQLQLTSKPLRLQWALYSSVGQWPKPEWSVFHPIKYVFQ